MQTPSSSSSLFRRTDTLFGVCAGVGQDCGFDPLYLRLLFAVLLLWNPVVVLAGYATLGVGVALSRWLFPVRATRPVGRIALVPDALPSPATREGDEAAAPAAIAA